MDLSNIHLELVSAIIGLARATEGNESLMTVSTNQVILEGLSNILKKQCENPTQIIQKIHDEKRKLIPLCFECAMPCGRTSDYDVRKIKSEDSEMLNLKIEIFKEVYKLSCTKDVLNNETKLNRMYQALIVIGLDDLSKEYLTFVFNQTKNIGL